MMTSNKLSESVGLTSRIGPGQDAAAGPPRRAQVDRPIAAGAGPDWAAIPRFITPRQPNRAWVACSGRAGSEAARLDRYRRAAGTPGYRAVAHGSHPQLA